MIQRTIIVLVMLFGAFTLQSLLKPEKCSGDEEYKVGLSKLGEFRLLKDYRVSLKSGSTRSQPMVSYPLSLTDGLTYKFIPINNSDNKGKMIIQIYMSDKREMLLASSYNESSKRHYPAIEFNCGHSGTYEIVFTFIHGEKGCGVGMFAVGK